MHLGKVINIPSILNNSYFISSCALALLKIKNTLYEKPRYPLPGNFMSD
jgi:hypothetical protein